MTCTHAGARRDTQNGRSGRTGSLAFPGSKRVSCFGERHFFALPRAEGTVIALGAGGNMQRLCAHCLNTVGLGGSLPAREGDVTVAFGTGAIHADGEQEGPGAVEGSPPAAMNLVHTARYTPYNFVFKNIYEQLQKQANVYFLVMSVLMLLGERTCLFVGTIKAWSTAGLLGLMMCVSGLVAAMDDVQRHRADRETNYERHARRVDGTALTTIPWAEVRVGDILEVCKDEEFPADMVALCSSDARGCCYVSTTNLDGETNLKLREAAWQSSGINAACCGDVRVPPPCADLFSFTGTLHAGPGAAPQPLSAPHLLMKGTRLRMTQRCRGVVVYVGADTRMQMNTKKAPSKMPNIERVVNVSMWVAVALQALMALLTTLTYVWTRAYFQALPYLYPSGFESAVCLPDALASFITFFVLYSNLVPVSLYATMEVCNAAFAVYIQNDPTLQMPDGMGRERRASVRATNLCHELGQINHVFSDKTGTLTQNVMRLHSLWPAEHSAPLRDERQRLPAHGSGEHMLFLAALLCHDARRDEEGQLAGTSAEEVALLQGAEAYGWKLIDRQGTRLRIQTPAPGKAREEEYELLAMNEFESTRKCMSVVVVNVKTRERTLLIKGADTALLGPDKDKQGKGAATQQLRADTCAGRGQRAMLAGWRSFVDDDCDAWLERYKRAACTSSTNRAAELSALAREVERASELSLAGVLCIEDKLQEYVPETIAALKDAGLCVWVLTGDCSGTAEAVARSASLLDAATSVVRFTDGRSWREARGALPPHHAAPAKRKGMAMIVGGREIERLEEADRASFVETALQMDALVACRVTPAQKAELVRMVRHATKAASLRAVTLAVGDGANDVGMIQEAQLGVGIVGREGMQAANSADFAVSQFQCLERLLLVHGHWSYARSAQVVLFSFWRNAVQELLMCYYTFASGFSGTPLFEDRIRITFNFLCTIPIVGFGLFDRRVPADVLLDVPQHYAEGREGKLLNSQAMFTGLGHAVLHSLVIAYVAACAMEPLHTAGIGDYWSFCVVTYTLLVLGCNYRVAFLSRTWNVALASMHLLSLGCYAAYLWIYNGFSLPPALTSTAAWVYQVPRKVFEHRITYFCVGASVLGQFIIDGVGELLWSSKTPTGDASRPACAADPLACRASSRTQPRRGSLLQAAKTQQLSSWQRSAPHVNTALTAAGVAACALSLVAAAGSLHTTLLAAPYGAAPTVVPQDVLFTLPETLRGKVLVSYVIEPFYQNYNLMRANLRLLSGSEFNDTVEFPGRNLSFDGVGWSTDMEMLRSARDAAAAHLAAWVRADASPRLEKRYGWLDAGLRAGTVQAKVTSAYDAAALGASKQLVLSSTCSVYGWSLAGYLMAAGLAALFVAQRARVGICPKDGPHQPLMREAP